MRRIDGILNSVPGTATPPEVGEVRSLSCTVVSVIFFATIAIVYPDISSERKTELFEKEKGNGTIVRKARGASVSPIPISTSAVEVTNRSITT